MAGPSPARPRRPGPEVGQAQPKAGQIEEPRPGPGYPGQPPASR